jgi:hypothetical protein
MGEGGGRDNTAKKISNCSFFMSAICLWDDASACVPTPLLLSTNGAYNCSRMEELFGLAY